MSIDALIASIGRGAAAGRPSWGEAIRTGVVFGVVETLTPLIGWTMGVLASRYVEDIDHWIAFTLLSGVGGRMIWQAFHRDAAAAAPPAGRSSRSSIVVLLATAVGTSIDAMVVGVSLAFLDVNILAIAVAIGAATTVMSTAGMLAGRFLGARFGRNAEIFGGLALIGLGCSILYQHLAG